MSTDDNFEDTRARELSQMFEFANLDDREQVIYAEADRWWATRFVGRGVYDKLGPFDSATNAVKGIMGFFRREEHDYPPPASIASRPFAVYASSTKHGDAHVIVGNVYRDGKHRPTHKEVSLKRQEEKALAKDRSRRRRNTPRPA